MKSDLRKRVTLAIMAFMLLQWAAGSIVLAKIQRARNERTYRTRITAALDRMEGYLSTASMEASYGLSSLVQLAETRAVLGHPNALEAGELPAAIRVRDRFIALNLDMLVLLNAAGQPLLYVCDQELQPWRDKPELYLPEEPVQINNNETHNSILLPQRHSSATGAVYVGKILDNVGLQGLLDSDMQGMIWREGPTRPIIYTKQPSSSFPPEEAAEGQIAWLPELEYQQGSSFPRFYGGEKTIQDVHYFAAVHREEDDRAIFNRSLILLSICLILLVPAVLLGRRWAMNLEKRCADQ